MKTCPRCAEQVQDTAEVCPYCGFGFGMVRAPHRLPPWARVAVGLAASAVLIYALVTLT